MHSRCCAMLRVYPFGKWRYGLDWYGFNHNARIITYADIKKTRVKLLVSAKFFYVPKIKVGFLAWNPTFFRYLCFYHKT